MEHLLNTVIVSSGMLFEEGTFAGSSAVLAVGCDVWAHCSTLTLVAFTLETFLRIKIYPHKFLYA